MNWRAIIAFCLLTPTVVRCQTTEPHQPTRSSSAIQTNTQCSVNAVKSNLQIGSLTCNSIDLNLAKQFKAIADGTKQDSKLLNLVLEQLRKLSDQLQPGASVQVNNNAPGGIAVSGGTVMNPIVNNFAPLQRTLLASQQEDLFTAIKNICSPTGPMVGLMWEPYEEPSNYARYFMKTFNDAKCLGYRAAAVDRAPGTLKGVVLVTPDWTNPSTLASAVRDAFVKSSINHTISSEKGLPGEVVVFVGTNPR